MVVTVLRAQEDEFEQLICGMQQAFQLYHEERFGKTDSIIRPREDILCVLEGKGTVFYKTVACGRIIAGAIVTVEEETRNHFLELLYVKHDEQNKGIGSEVWKQIEALYPDAEVWETCVASDEVRNVCFYTEKCGFRFADYMNDIPEEERPVLVLRKYR